MRLGQVMIVGGDAVAGNFAEDIRARAPRACEIFEREKGRAFTENQAAAPLIERAGISPDVAACSESNPTKTSSESAS